MVLTMLLPFVMYSLYWANAFCAFYYYEGSRAGAAECKDPVVRATKSLHGLRVVIECKVRNSLSKPGRSGSALAFHLWRNILPDPKKLSALFGVVLGVKARKRTVAGHTLGGQKDIIEVELGNSLFGRPAYEVKWMFGSIRRSEKIIQRLFQNHVRMLY